MAIGFYFLTDLVGAAFGMFSKHGSGVAFGAHVGGFLGGLALIAFYKWMVQTRAAEAGESRLIIDPATILASSDVQVSPSASSETPTIFLHDGTEQTGPFTLTEVQAKLLRGEISRESEYWSEGMADWQSVVDLSSQPLA